MYKTITVTVYGEHLAHEYGPPTPCQPLTEAEAKARGQAMIERWIMRDIDQLAVDYPVTARRILDEWNATHKVSFDSLSRMRAVFRHSKKRAKQLKRLTKRFDTKP